MSSYSLCWYPEGGGYSPSVYGLLRSRKFPSLKFIDNWRRLFSQRGHCPLGSITAPLQRVRSRRRDQHCYAISLPEDADRELMRRYTGLRGTVCLPVSRAFYSSFPPPRGFLSAQVADLSVDPWASLNLAGGIAMPGTSERQRYRKELCSVGSTPSLRLSPPSGGTVVR